MTQNTEKSIAIMGCGNIGSRLLQSLAQIDSGSIIHIDAFEPIPENQIVAIQRFQEKLGDRGHQLRFVKTTQDFQRSYDLGIVATDARNRLCALSALLNSSKLTNLVLEKVLFTKASEYAAASTLLEQHQIKTWVNCSRSVWPGYQSLKNEIDGKFIRRVVVEGSNWGVACNGIHFLALAEFLTDTPVAALKWSKTIAPRIYDAKRPGYKEIVGFLEGQTARDTVIQLVSHDGVDMPMTIKIELEDIRYTLFEGECQIQYDKNGNHHNRDFCSLKTSQLSSVFSQILNKSTCELPEYKQSASLHLKTMAAMNEIFYGNPDLSNECPIT